MRVSGLIFMLISWGFIIYLIAFCIYKTLKNR
jgi:hypothetical protein